MNNCPCNSQKNYAECCEPYIQGKNLAPTPEALMRSRYTAYSLANMEYIAQTMKGAVAQEFKPEQALEFAKQAKWLGLEVIEASPIDNNRGFVEFVIYYLFNGKKQHINEISEFHREADTWYYVDGKPGRTVTRETNKDNKVGRNDPCPCNSGKKYKKCCGN